MNSQAQRKLISKRVVALASGLTLVAILGGCAYFSGKTVAGKEAPNMLTAADGSICIVSKTQFEKTEVGMKALCAWRGGRIPAPQFTPAARTVRART